MMNKKYKDLMQDQVKLRVVQWAVANPNWSPEALIAITKMFLKHYGLGNRYLPPDFKKEEEVPNANSDRVEATDGGPT